MMSSNSQSDDNVKRFAALLRPIKKDEFDELMTNFKNDEFLSKFTEELKIAYPELDDEYKINKNISEWITKRDANNAGRIRLFTNLTECKEKSYIGKEVHQIFRHISTQLYYRWRYELSIKSIEEVQMMEVSVDNIFMYFIAASPISFNTFTKIDNDLNGHIFKNLTVKKYQVRKLNFFKRFFRRKKKMLPEEKLLSDTSRRYAKRLSKLYHENPKIISRYNIDENVKPLIECLNSPVYVISTGGVSIIDLENDGSIQDIINSTSLEKHSKIFFVKPTLPFKQQSDKIGKKTKSKDNRKMRFKKDERNRHHAEEYLVDDAEKIRNEVKKKDVKFRIFGKKRPCLYCAAKMKCVGIDDYEKEPGLLYLYDGIKISNKELQEICISNSYISRIPIYLENFNKGTISSFNTFSDDEFDGVMLCNLGYSE